MRQFSHDIYSNSSSYHISACMNVCEVCIVTTNILSIASITQDNMSASMDMVGYLESSLLVYVFVLLLTICEKSSLNLTRPFSYRNSNCSKADYFSSSLKMKSPLALTTPTYEAVAATPSQASCLLSKDC